ncbi:hypothetical protein QFZ31_004435 [Neobacillus niacini]|nr:hypothetical protein [Neobacillus niacini]
MKYGRSVCGLKKFADLHYEGYTYDNNRISEEDFFFYISPQSELYEEDRLRVKHAQDGNIIRLISDKIVDGKADQFTYNVKPPKR